MYQLSDIGRILATFPYTQGEGQGLLIALPLAFFTERKVYTLMNTDSFEFQFW